MTGPAPEWDDLPRFERPPVSEVAVGVEFVPAQELTAVELVKLHLAWQELYPTMLEQPPMPPAPPVEGSALQGFGIQLTSGAGPIRLWLLSPDQHQLIQVQHDRFILNWRKLDDDSDYPSYDSLREVFVDRWAAFLEYLAGRIEIRPTVVEVTFVNTIEGTPESTPELASTLASAAPVPLPKHTKLLAARAQYVCSVEHSDGARGSLVITAEPGADQGGTLVLATRIGLQGESPSTDDLMTAMDLAHGTGVEAFASITTVEKHKSWGRTR